MEFSTVLKKNFGVDFLLLFWIRLKLPGSWAPFWPLSSRNLAKRGPAGSLWITMIFLVAGALFWPSSGLQNGVWQPLFWISMIRRFIFLLLDPFLSRQRSGCSKKGSQQQGNKRYVWLLLLLSGGQITTTGSQCLFVPCCLYLVVCTLLFVPCSCSCSCCCCCCCCCYRCSFL